MRWRRLIALLCLSLLLITGWASSALFGDLPSPNEIIQRSAPNTTKIYDRNGQLLFEMLDPRAGRRTRVNLAELPVHLRQAVIAVEDANYYEHPGIDLVGVARAVVQAFQQEQVVSGGSTITQQLARELLLSREERESRTVARKLREMALALRLTAAYSKDTILEMYLNEVYFGQLAYGVEAAARAYFGKPARELDLAESALVAGLIQSPAKYNPLVNLDAAKTRQKVVLGLMVKRGYITEREAELANGERLHLIGRSAESAAVMRAPHFVVYVRNLLETQYGAEQVNHGGMRVTTTLDLNLQEQAEAVIRNHLAELRRRTREEATPDYQAGDAALIVLNPETGEILAMVGSADYFDTQIDGAVNVALARRQPGSAIKPITYAAAFIRGYTPATVLSDVPTAFLTKEGEPYQPQNYDRVWHGPISLRQALATSSNMIAVKVLDQVGVGAVIETARMLGITTLDDESRLGLSLTLGGGEVTLLELTAAYAAFANSGRRVSPTAIMQVERANLTPDTPPVPRSSPSAVTPQAAYLITHILSDNAARIPAFGEESALKLSRPAAAKTGTTTDFRDNWTIGYTPDLAVGVWVGNADNTPMYKVSGVAGAGPIWHDFMESAHAGRPPRDFKRPQGIVEVEVCETSGLLATAACPRRRWELFAAGAEPIRVDDSYISLDVDSATGLLWNDGCAGQRITKVFRLLPPDARDWGQEQGIEQPPTVDCHAQARDWKSQLAVNDLKQLVITHPAPNATFALTSQLPLESQRIELTARTGTASKIRSMKLLLDGKPIGEFFAPPYRALWQATAGTHTLQAIGVDDQRQAFASEIITFHVQASGE